MSIDDFGRKLNQQITRHQTQRTTTRSEVFGRNADFPIAPEPLPDLTGLSAEDALLAYDEWANNAVARQRTAFIEGRIVVESASYTRRQYRTLGDDNPLEVVNELFEQLFDIGRIFPDVRPNTTIVPCGDSAEFIDPLIAANITTRQQAVRIQQTRLAYYLPERGCFVNGQKLRDIGGGTALHVALQQHDLFDRALCAVAEELWGWGFWLTYTRTGQERLRRGKWRDDLRHRLGITDTVNDVSYQHSILTVHGYCTWVGHILLDAARRRRNQAIEPRVRFSLRRLWEVVQKSTVEGVKQFAIADPLAALSAFLVTAATESRHVLHWIHRRLHKLHAQPHQQVNRVLVGVFGRTLDELLSDHLINSVEARVGSFCVPYALLIAGHVEYNLQTTTPSELERLLNDPYQSIDTRWWLLSKLDKVAKYDIATVANAAREQLYLDSPERLRSA